ncbi:hypothetical protein, partial [Escherichia coli]|uniref:hypothetical protein n=1 Tax=Escherichia coli TaxID=562 RepID=UPI001BC87A77
MSNSFILLSLRTVSVAVSYTHLTLPTTLRSCVDLGGSRVIKKKPQNKKNIQNKLQENILKNQKKRVKKKKI